MLTFPDEDCKSSKVRVQLNLILEMQIDVMVNMTTHQEDPLERYLEYFPEAYFQSRMYKKYVTTVN